MTNPTLPGRGEAVDHVGISSIIASIIRQQRGRHAVSEEFNSIRWKAHAMNSPLTQAGKSAKLLTPFGKDVLVLTQFEGTEALGELFEFRIQALSEQEDL